MLTTRGVTEPSTPAPPSVAPPDPSVASELPAAASTPVKRPATAWAAVAVAFVGLGTIVGICAVLIQAAPAAGAGGTSAAGPNASALALAPTDAIAGLVAAPTATPSASDEDLVGPALDDAPPVLSGSAAPPKPPSRFKLVSDVAARSCSTAGVRGLSDQIIAEARCIRKDAYSPIPRLSNLSAGEHVSLFLETPARDHLVRALKSQPKKKMTLNSALRTVAQQYILDRWYRTKRCGIQLASDPGTSNHETGLALDVSEYGAWRKALEKEGFQWMGKSDRVHFDYRGPDAVDHRGLDVIAFKRLWNRNHPDDQLPETADYDGEVAARIAKSPAAGFATGPRCGAPRPH